MLIKNQVEVGEIICAIGNAAFMSNVPARDATPLRKLEVAGATALGKSENFERAASFSRPASCRER